MNIYSLVLVGVGPIFSTTAALVYWYKGVPNAKYFALGWSVAHLTSFLDFFRIIGVLPYGWFLAHSLEISLPLSLIFFTLAIVQQTYTYRYQADRDGLTCLANRRYFDRALQSEWNRNLRHGRPLSVVMADVDHFKEYNDTYGHRAGDQRLTDVAQILGRYARRPGDLAARYGGEEFVLLLPETDAKEAARVAEMIRSEVEGRAWPHKTSKVKGVLTLSLGAATLEPSEQGSPAALVKEADKALYKAKNNGRNQAAYSEGVVLKEGECSPQG